MMITALCTMSKVNIYNMDNNICVYYRIPVEVWPEEYVAKPETYPGPRGLPIEISATDKRFIKRKYKEGMM